ncbi:MFS transporter [Nocardia sp. CDC153]|uniref:MFS transporter n=1 Tax=Nocardia sp. CDC153 TaxID=3112167 RepID=UPI002DBD7BA6|nr:MFS transporter [Nocardia sp. CDC153]MEC3956367.1 MFS transporter [Nocardia sp. CDC153]
MTAVDDGTATDRPLADIDAKVAASQAKPPTGLGRIVAAAMAGAVAEWYEFFLYGTASALVFGQVFFRSSGNAIDGVIAAFALYAVGFLARPFGGMLFGHFGDRLGRKALLQVSLVIVGVSTFLIGCLPTYGVIGSWAPILLVALRLVQGFAFGGEWGGAVLLVSEHSPDHRRGFWASWPQAGVPLGNILATLVMLALSAQLSDAQFLAWGWRVGFWLSAVVVIIGYWVRSSVDDAPIFREAQAKHRAEQQRSPGLIAVLRHHRRAVLIGIGARFAENILYYLVVTFSITYLKLVVHVDTAPILTLMLLAHLLHLAMIPAAGLLSDLIGRRPVYLTGAVLTAGWGFVAFPMMDTGNYAAIMVAITLGLAIESLTYAPYSALLTEMFPTRVRYTALSFCYQVAPILAGSLAPLIAVGLLDRLHSSVPISLYLVAAAVISVVAVGLARETVGTSLRAVDAAAAER